MKAASAAVAAAALVVGAVPVALADGIAQLKSFYATTRSGSVEFRQIVVTKGRGMSREASGRFSFQRPGRFRWSYEKPYEQLIVGDGERLWIYDRDLNQVTVRRLDAALGSTPAALLAGDAALERNFELADAGRRDGLDYVEAKPRAPDTGFTRVRIGLAENLPRAMELTDSFGNVTVLRFDRFDRNAAPDEALFRFVPPTGADVVGDAR